MFRSLLWLDLKTRLRRFSAAISFFAYFSLFFLLALFLAGAFSWAPLLSNTAVNGPFTIQNQLMVFALLGMPAAAAAFSRGVSRDFETGFHQILFATPLHKKTYFAARFFAASLWIFLLSLTPALAIFLASCMPFANPALVIKAQAWFYLAPYLTSVLPNIFIFGSLFLSLASLSKKTGPSYACCICLFMGYLACQPLLGDIDSRYLAALIDPTGLIASGEIARYWSTTEKLTQCIPLSGIFLYNRLLWVAIGAAALCWAFLRFNPFYLPREKKKSPEVLLNSKTKPPAPANLRPGSLKALLQFCVSECRQTLRSRSLWLILLGAALWILSLSKHVGTIFGTPTLPVTYAVLDVLGAGFEVVFVILIAYCAGELVWKDKSFRFCEIVDSKPVSNAFLFLSKFFCLGLIEILLLCAVWGACLLVQICKGYTHFEWGVYLQSLFVYTLPVWLLRSVFVLCIQTLSPSKAVGHALVALWIAVAAFLPKIGLNHALYSLAEPISPVYSDMNGFGTFFWPFFLETLYWGSLLLCLAAVSTLFWRRGHLLSWKERLSECKTRIRALDRRLFAFGFSCWIALGCCIYFNTDVLNVYKTKWQKEQDQANYEIRYAKFKDAPHPSLKTVRVQVDLYPESLSMQARGIFEYRNETAEPIQTLLVYVPPYKTELRQFTWDRSTSLISVDGGVRIYEFSKPLLPNETARLDFHIAAREKGFESGAFPIALVENGTFFIGSNFFPSVGYGAGFELTDSKTRKKYGLPERLPAPDISDPKARMHTCISLEGTWIDFEATVSTSSDQMALAPGHLEKEWSENGRRYFHYKAPSPILPLYAFVSGRYEVKRDQWNDVAIEVYHHPGHGKNVPRMIESIQKSLAYYSENFSPYQFKQIRIVEFPRYQSIAMSFPSMIPYSESIGFIADVDQNNPESIDYPFYITAHEVAHQWWAHQVIGANTQGAAMVSESLAQYSALMVLEKEHGPAQMKKFLKYELHNYLMQRSIAPEKESPLMLTAGQQHIHYSKGSLVFYALKDLLGEETVNRVLKGYIQDFAFQGPPFTTSADLVARFKQSASEDQRPMISDLFEKIAFYDCRTLAAFSKKNPDGTYRVELQALAKKVYADGAGSEQEATFDDWMDVGVFDRAGTLIYLQKHRIHSGLNQISVQVDREPAKAGVDPLSKLINKTLDANLAPAYPMPSLPQ